VRGWLIKNGLKGQVILSITHSFKKESDMPYVNIKITEEQVTPQQKAALIKGATQLLVDVLNKNPATTVVVIDEVNTDNWGIGGQVVTDIRRSSTN